MSELFSTSTKLETAWKQFRTFYSVKGYLLLLPLFSENLVISEKLWDNHSEKGQFGLVHMANLIGTDQFNLSHTIGMALRNAAKNKKMDYSKRGEIDLFQTI